MPVLGLCCCPKAFSGCSEQGLLSSCGARASHCSGSLCCGLSCPVACGVLVPRPGIKPVSPAVEGSDS